MRRMEPYSQDFGKFFLHGFIVHPGLCVVRGRSLENDWTQWMIAHAPTGAAIIVAFYTDKAACDIADKLADGLDWLTVSSQSEPHRSRTSELRHLAVSSGLPPVKRTF